MKVGPRSHLTLHYRISLAESGADVANTFGSRPATIQMGLGHLGQSLELVMLGMSEGEHRAFELPASQAYGERNSQLLQRLSRKMLAESSPPGTQYEPGDLIEIPAPAGGNITGILRTLDADTALAKFPARSNAGRAYQMWTLCSGAR